jgi:RCC1 and BTB domain-containing protein
MWGQCHGQSIVTPTDTPFKSVHEIFAFFGTPSVTFKPMVTEMCSGPSLLDTLKLAFDDPNTADIKFVGEKKEIHVHKSILKIRYFL